MAQVGDISQIGGLRRYELREGRAPRLFDDLALDMADGRYRKILAGYALIDLLVIDDWGLAHFTEEQCRDVLEILVDRPHIPVNNAEARRWILLTSPI